jgi:hypothetical protein
VNIDLSPQQRQQLIAQIQNDFHIANPKLLPLHLANPTLQNTVLDQIVGFGDGIQSIFPTNFQIGSDFAFAVGSRNSGFAQVVGNLSHSPNGETIVADPHFGMNLAANAEFVGDPWTADIDCDLGQVWSQTRSSFGGSASLGWFRIGSAQYSSIAQALQRAGACTYDMKEGSMDTATFGRQVMEMTKDMFTQINNAAAGGQGFFKFEPNPEAPAVGGGGGGGINLFGWSVSINLSYSSASFTQSIKWHTRVSYTGHAMYPVALGTALAVACNQATAQYFEDLRDATEPCITQAKVDLFNARLTAEIKAKAPLYADLRQKLETGSMTPEAYKLAKTAIDQMVITDTTYTLANISLPGLSGAKVVTGDPAPQAAGNEIFVMDARTGKYVLRAPGSEFRALRPLQTLENVEKRLENSTQRPQ